MTTSGERADTGLSVVSLAVQLGNPVAGSDWTTGIGATNALIVVTAQLVTSATVANRLPSLQLIGPGAIVVASLPASSVQAAGSTETYVWGVGLPFTSGQGVNLVPIPTGIVLGLGWTLRTSTSGLQAGDQWSAINVTFAG